tara:strand:+ start:258 stop:464 length:207 start_codon:yes stop_codon:yes gene_type:complete
MIKKAILEALEKQYRADISAADATIKIYLHTSVGIGEHPQHIQEVDKLIQKIADAEEKLGLVKEYLDD